MKKSSKKKSLIILLLIVFVAVTGTYTYSRYVTSKTGNATVTVAKWNVAMKKEGTEVTNNFDLPFTVTGNANVVDGKIAPGTTATAVIDVDLTGTEVAIDYEATIDNVALEALFGSANVEVTTTANFSGTTITSGTIALPDGAAFDADDNLQITVSLTWDNEESKNVGDTALGTSADGTAIELPVTLTVKQHITEPIE